MVRENSGFGWDDNLKMITAPPDVYDDYIEKHPQREKYLNKKIEMYEEMSIVVGKDIARGNFAKSFSDIEVDSTPEPSKICDKIDTSRSESDTSSQPRQHRKRSRVDEENTEVQLITSQLGEVASALHKLACQKLDVNKLYDEIMKIEGFDDVFLAKAFDHLVEHEQLAKAFLAKNDRLRKIWLETFTKNN